MILNRTYFEKGELFIPNSVNGNSGNPASAIEDDLDVLIEKYEREVLLSALGVELYNEFASQTFINGGIDNSAPQKWKDFVNGKEYDNKIWNGLKGDSVLAYFVYCKYLTLDEVRYSTTGMAIEGVVNAQPAGYNTKYIHNWNIFLKKYQGGPDQGPRVLVNAWGAIGLDYYSRQDKDVSMYQYLMDNESVYPDFQFDFYPAQNSLWI